MLRRWAAWLGLWSLGASALLWGTAAVEVPALLGGRRPLPPDETATADGALQLVAVLGVALPVLFVLVALTWSLPQSWSLVPRLGLGLGGLALLVSAWTWSSVPDAGPLWPAVAAGAGVLALVGFTARSLQGDSPDGRMPGVALALTGATVAVLGWGGLDYNQWQAGVHTVPLWAALVLGVLLVPLGLGGHRLPDNRLVAMVAVLLSGAVALVALVPATLWMLDLGQLGRHEESETGWEAVLPVVVGTGFLAAACAATRRRWPLAALSLAVGLGLGVGSVLRSDLARLLW